MYLYYLDGIPVHVQNEEKYALLRPFLEGARVWHIDLKDARTKQKLFTLVFLVISHHLKYVHAAKQK